MGIFDRLRRRNKVRSAQTRFNPSPGRGTPLDHNALLYGPLLTGDSDRPSRHDSDNSSSHGSHHSSNHDSGYSGGHHSSSYDSGSSGGSDGGGGGGGGD